LDDLFLLVVVGEFNAGKSACINALLGQKLLKEGVTPTTTQINLLRYGADQERIVVDKYKNILLMPIDWLSEISIVDTPGTNAIVRIHEEITSQFIPRSDLVLFITSADRPFTESERAFLESIRDWGKKIVIAINKIDILQSRQDTDKIIDFVAENARTLIGVTPEIFPISARSALQAKQGEPTKWQESRFENLESFIQNSLDEKSRIRLKLLNPLGVGIRLAGRYLEIVCSRLDILKEDIGMLSDIEAQLEQYREDMIREFKFRMSDVENILFEMDQRGQDYFDETFRLARVFDLLSKDRIRHEFEQEVVGDVPQQIESKVSELIDWLVETDLRQWQAVNEHISDRRRTHKKRIVGDIGPGHFSYDRDRLIEAVGRKAQRVVETYDKETEAREIASVAQNAVAASAAIEVGAVGLGTIVAILATTMAADVTGVLMASLVATLGLFVIPARRRIAKSEMRQKVTSLREKLTETLHKQFDHEIERSIQVISEAIGPYSRFIRAEQNSLSETKSTLETQINKFNRLKGIIEEI
jgi:small GTP-binding protein